METGASAETVANAIFRRIEIQHTDLPTRVGSEALYSAVMDVAQFHAGCEELGSSDISIMVKQVLKNLGVNKEIS